MKSVLVGLDLTKMDDDLIAFASVICKSFPVTEIYFMHAAKNLELPEETLQNYNEVLATVDDGIENAIKEKVDKFFTSQSGVEVHIEVKEGNAVEKILRFAKIKNIDLIMLGRKQRLSGSGVVTHSITRKSPCHMLLVPDTDHAPEIKNILVPVDFSKHSKITLNEALELAERNKANVTCVHLYEVPTGYTRIGKTYEEFAEIMLGHAKNDFKKFIKDVTYPVDCKFVLAENNEDDHLTSFISGFNADIVFIGSKGRTDAAVVLLGSMAEKLTRKINDTPIFVVKRKGENVGFFEALLQI